MGKVSTMDLAEIGPGGILKKCLIILVLAALLPWVYQFTKFADYLTYITVRMMILGLYAMSYDLIFGYTGLFSFGHASFMAGGAYSFAILMRQLGLPINDALTGVLAAMVAGLIIGLFMGFLASRLGSHLAVFLVTFAITESLFLLTIVDPLNITGGENGIAGIPRETFLGFFNIKSEINFFYLTLALLILTFLLLRLIIRSSFGDTLQAIRENPQRVRFLGYNIRHYRMVAFMISGLFASLAGALTALHEQSVGPEMFAMYVSGDAFIYTVLGGAGTLVGPLMGTVLMVIAQETLSYFFHNWLIFVGIIYIGLVIFMPKGLFPLFSRQRSN